MQYFSPISLIKLMVILGSNNVYFVLLLKKYSNKIKLWLKKKKCTCQFHEQTEKYHLQKLLVWVLCHMAARNAKLWFCKSVVLIMLLQLSWSPDVVVSCARHTRGS
jgi:hypothetical protein